VIQIPAELLGRDFDFGEAVVDAETIKRYAEMVGDAPTLAAIERGGEIVAPPTFCLSLHHGMRPEVPLPEGMFGVYGGHDLEFLRPLRAGMTYRVGARLADVYEKNGRSGTLTMIARHGWIRTATGEIAVRIHERQVVRRKPTQSPAAAPVMASRDGDAAVQASTAAPQARPASEIELGTELGPLRRPATTVAQVSTYVARGEMKEELFTDATQARALGYRGIVVPGPMLTAFLEHFVRAQLPGWRLERLGTTFRLPTITGDPLLLSGVVSQHHQRADGEHIVCDLVVEHPSGERAVTAAATLRRVLKVEF